MSLAECHEAVSQLTTALRDLVDHIDNAASGNNTICNRLQDTCPHVTSARLLLEIRATLTR